MAGIYLTIGSREDLTKFLQGAVNAGYLRKVDLRKVNDYVNTVSYPINVPVDLDFVLKLGSNKMVRSIFGKTIDDGFTKFVKKVMETGL